MKEGRVVWRYKGSTQRSEWMPKDAAHRQAADERQKQAEYNEGRNYGSWSVETR